MKLNTITKVALGAVVAAGMYSCQNGDEFFAIEHYEKMVYIISDKNTNIFDAEYELTGEEVSMKTLPIAVSGSNPIDNDVHVTLEYDPDKLNEYNQTTYLDDEKKYAREVNTADYVLPTYSVEIKAGVDPTYEVGRLPIQIKEEVLNKLNVDSTYFISLRIKEADPYPVNEDKKDVLYRILKKNVYASQKEGTYYTTEGYVNGGYFSTSKKVMPLTYNSIRAYVGAEVYSNEDTEAVILKKAMKISVGPDNKLTLAPFKEESTLKIEMLTASTDPADETYPYKNEYNPEKKRFYLYYRFDIGNGWVESREIMTSEEALEDED